MFNVFTNISKLLVIFDKRIISLVPLILLFLLSTFLDLLSIALVAPFISLIIEPENVFFGKNFINYFL